MISRSRVWVKRCLILLFLVLFIQVASMVGTGWVKGETGLESSKTEWQRQSVVYTGKLSSDGLSGAWASLYTMTVQRLAPPQVAANLAWSNATFHIYQDLPLDYTCDNLTDGGPRLKSCKKVKQMVDYMVSKQQDTKSPDLYIVPMDYLALRATESTNKSEAVIRVLDTMTRGFRYLHFGGSNHVLLCLTDGCGEIMQEVLVRHRLGKDTRAMWVGAKQYLQDLRQQWPCPDRVFSASKSLLKFVRSSTPRAVAVESSVSGLDEGAKDMLQSALKKIEGPNRWACSKPRWGLDLGHYKGKKHQGCVAVTRHKLCITEIPKCASSTMNVFLERMSGLPYWNDSSRNAHGPQNGLTWVNPSRNYDAYIGNYTDTSVVKIAILRDPEKRLVSGHLDKFVEHDGTGRIGLHRKGNEPPSLEEVIDRLTFFLEEGRIDDIDLHFRPQSNFGSLRDVRYDFVATVSSLSDDLETILTSLGLWERYGASGWGEDGSLSFKEHKGRNRKPKSVYTVQATPEQRKKIYEIYSEDYHRFGFPMENV